MSPCSRPHMELSSDLREVESSSSSVGLPSGSQFRSGVLAKGGRGGGLQLQVQWVGSWTWKCVVQESVPSSVAGGDETERKWCFRDLFAEQACER